MYRYGCFLHTNYLPSTRKQGSNLHNICLGIIYKLLPKKVCTINNLKFCIHSIFKNKLFLVLNLWGSPPFEFSKLKPWFFLKCIPNLLPIYFDLSLSLFFYFSLTHSFFQPLYLVFHLWNSLLKNVFFPKNSNTTVTKLKFET